MLFHAAKRRCAKSITIFLGGLLLLLLPWNEKANAPEVSDRGIMFVLCQTRIKETGHLCLPRFNLWSLYEACKWDTPNGKTGTSRMLWPLWNTEWVNKSSHLRETSRNTAHASAAFIPYVTVAIPLARALVPLGL